MLTPGDLEFAGNAVGYDAGFGSPEVSAELAALVTALSRLISISDGVADAVRRHDRIALDSSNAQADAQIGEVNRLNAVLSAEDRTMMAVAGIPALSERLAAGSRRNAYLIEQAWAVDAALMRLLLGLGKVGADGAVGGYASNPGPTYVDRQA
jgi:hypothetical protein